MNKFKENKGAIILLYGTSTSGKTTICKELSKFINHLKVDSTDIAFKRLEEQTFDKIHNYFNDNKNQFPDYSYVKTIFTEAEIYNGISNERVKINDKEISLMFDLDEQAFQRGLDGIISEEYSLEKKAIITLRKIAKSYLDQLYISVHEEMFNLAIINSMQQIPIILDIVPHPALPGQFMIDLFLEQFKKNEYSCPIHIALVHCSIFKLSERMFERNRYAKINEDIENIRDKSFPFRQYSQLFGALKTEKPTCLGTLKIQDARKIIALFCTNPNELNKIIEQIGFIDGQSDEIKIDVKCDYDQIYNADLQTSTEIAEKIYDWWIEKGKTG